MGDELSQRKASGPDEAKGQAKSKRLFMKQPNMQRVLYALIPVFAAGVYFFGWRVSVLVGLCIVAGVGTEYVTSRRRGAPISTACLVSCCLYALSLPPTMPFWMAVVGVVVGILFGKEVFGGFGRNFANPAIVGRVFVYVAFPVAMTGSFVPVLRGWLGGFGRWSLAGAARLPEWLSVNGQEALNAVTAATPMWARRDFGYETQLGQLFFGNIGGVFEAEGSKRVLAAGSIGEVSAALIILAGVYLLVTRTANWRLMLSPLAAGVVTAALLRHVGGVGAVPPIPFVLCSGGFLYGAVFMVTEPVSAPKKALSMWIYGGLIGALIVLLRWKSQFAGAVGFAILLGNICGPCLDMVVGAWKKKNKPVEGRATEARNK